MVVQFKMLHILIEIIMIMIMLLGTIQLVVFFIVIQS